MMYARARVCVCMRRLVSHRNDTFAVNNYPNYGIVDNEKEMFIPFIQLAVLGLINEAADVNAD